MDITKLEALGLSPEMIRAIQDTGYEEFTPIQQKAIPVLMEGRDIIGQASTGTGKTAAFGIPAIEMVTDPEETADPQILVLCPTRELARSSDSGALPHPGAGHAGQRRAPQVLQV